jgi:hypothetical protein
MYTIDKVNLHLADHYLSLFQLSEIALLNTEKNWAEIKTLFLEPVSEPLEPNKALEPVSEPLEPNKALEPVSEPLEPNKALEPVSEPLEPNKALEPVSDETLTFILTNTAKLVINGKNVRHLMSIKDVNDLLKSSLTKSVIFFNDTKLDDKKYESRLTKYLVGTNFYHVKDSGLESHYAK